MSPTAAGLTVIDYLTPPLLLDIQAHDEIGASVGLENEHDLFLWNVVFEGPADTLYEVSKEVFVDQCFDLTRLISLCREASLSRS